MFSSLFAVGHGTKADLAPFLRPVHLQLQLQLLRLRATRTPPLRNTAARALAVAAAAAAEAHRIRRFRTSARGLDSATMGQAIDGESALKLKRDAFGCDKIRDFCFKMRDHVRHASQLHFADVGEQAERLSD